MSVVDLVLVVPQVKADNAILRSQVSHFANVQKALSQLMFFTLVST